jgi:hypothetical protein
MPYIEQKNREKFNDLIDNVFINLDEKNWEGELNYIFSMLIKNVLDTNQRLNYKNINAAVGVLECCKQELYRMTAAPYEDIKINNNGGL